MDRHVVAGWAGGDHELPRHRVYGHRRRASRLGSGHPSLVPYQSFPASDGYFILACANDGLWERACRAVGRAEFLEDPRFKTNTDRVAHRAECVELFSQLFQTDTVAHWVELISDAGVPCGPINRVSDVVNDPRCRPAT